MDPQVRLKNSPFNMLSLRDLFEMMESHSPKNPHQHTAFVTPAVDGHGGYAACVGGKLGYGINPEHALFAAAQHYFNIDETERTRDDCRWDYRAKPTSKEAYARLVDWLAS